VTCFTPEAVRSGARFSVGVLPGPETGSAGRRRLPTLGERWVRTDDCVGRVVERCDTLGDGVDVEAGAAGEGEAVGGRAWGGGV
jgi:hypothetical protein